MFKFVQFSRSAICASVAVLLIVCAPFAARAQQASFPDDATATSPPADTSAAADNVPSGVNTDAVNATKLPQVEVITDLDEPSKVKTNTKKQAGKNSPSQKSRKSAAQTSSAEADAGQGAADANGEGSHQSAPSGPGAAGIVKDYVATDSTAGTKTDTPLKETPQSVSVVGKEQMRDQGVQNLQEALRYSPGILADAFGYDSRGDYTSIRGTIATYFIDGMRTTYGGYTTTAPIEPFSLERVEALRGPASMLYGQSPTGGLINGVSKLPLDIPYREIGVDYGSFDFKQTRFDLTGPLSTDGKWLYRIVGLARDADTQVDYVPNDRLFIAPSLTYRPTNSTNITVLGNFRSDHTGSTQQFLPQIGTLTPNVDGKRVPRDAFLGEPGDHNDTDVQSGTLLIDHKFSDALQFHQGMRYTHVAAFVDTTYPAILTPARFGFVNSLLADIGAPPIDASNAPFLDAAQSEIARARAVQHADSAVFNSDTNLVARFSTGGLQHKVLGGFDYMRFSLSSEYSGLLIDNLLTPNSAPGLPPEMQQSVFNIYAPRYGRQTYYLNPFGSNPFLPADQVEMVPDTDQLQTQAGLYLQDQLKLGRWSAILGVRQDWLSIRQEGSPEDNEAATTGRAALLYSFDSGLTPYVSYSTSFNPLPGQPVGTDLFASFIDQTPARPVKGEQVEAGFKFQPDGAPFMLSAAIYELTDRNQIVQPDILFAAVQGADVNVRGFEIEAVGKITPELKVIASYSYTDATYEKYPELYPFASGIAEFMEGQRVEGIPENLASFWAIYTWQSGWLRGLSLGGGVRYVGETESIGRDVGTGNELYVKTPSFTLFDAMVAYETQDWRWQLTAQNLADDYTVMSCSAYRGDCAIGQARTIITGLTYKF
jgi:iron complex outermembrane recepter protein